LYNIHIEFVILHETTYTQASLTACVMLVSCLVYSSALKMEALCPSETFVDSAEYTELYSRRYDYIITDLRSLNPTISHFINIYIVVSEIKHASRHGLQCTRSILCTLCKNFTKLMTNLFPSITVKNLSKKCQVQVQVQVS
jgi:hypothetical protein